jgi:uncharacterized Tic20 family protein
MSHETPQVPDPQRYPDGGEAGQIPSTQEERSTGMLLHLSQFLGLAGPVLAIIGPLVIWMLKRDTSKYLDWHGREAVNFQITALLAWCAAVVVSFLTCGIGAFLFPVLYAAIVVGVIVAAVRANEGKCWRYPLTLRLVK